MKILTLDMDKFKKSCSFNEVRITAEQPLNEYTYVTVSFKTPASLFETGKFFASVPDSKPVKKESKK